jgi:oligosaccharide repeat unit polymerase
MIGLVGFSLDNVMNYRLAANDVMNSGSGYVGLVFRLTAYIQMLANFYVALYGFGAGFGKLNFKKIFIIFILYAPTQMATGGRLFVLYFIIFFFGSFFLARGLSMNIAVRKWILPEEKRAITFIFAGLLTFVAIIGMSRAVENGKYVGKESFVEKFSYITEGMLATEYFMQQYPDGSFQHDNGMATIKGNTNNDLQFRRNLNMTRMSSIVISIILPLYLDFGFWGSLIVWFIIALFIESLSLRCLGKLTIIRFLILVTLLKICYESVMSNPINGNIPVYELIILLALFYKPLLGRFERSEIQV